MVSDGFNPSFLNNAVAVGRVFLVKSIHTVPNAPEQAAHGSKGVCNQKNGLNILEAGIEEGVSTL